MHEFSKQVIHLANVYLVLTEYLNLRLNLLLWIIQRFLQRVRIARNAERCTS